MLVGESLVKAGNIAGQLGGLLKGANQDTQVKICGLKQPEHILASVEAGADLLGLNFYQPSPRYISPEQANKLVLALSPEARARTEIVGLFVNAEVNFINAIAEQIGLDIVQLHGDESPEFCRLIQRPVIKAVHVSSKIDLNKAAAYQECTWRLLLDTPTPGYGGSGITNDWELAAQAARQARVFLAGGLTPANVASAITQVHPWGVDVSSGVETDKIKSVSKIRAFVHFVRETDL
jgi:phosphoribosylanthranilate isomerase